MSHRNVPAAIYSSDAARDSTTTSSATTEKYPANNSMYQPFPEVVTQPPSQPLQSHQQPGPVYHQQQYQYTNGYATEASQPPTRPLKPNPWDLSPLAFGLLIAAITALVVGGVVGGGVAGALSGHDSSSSSTRVSTATVTSGATATATQSLSSTTTSSGLPSPSSLENFVVPEPYYVDTLQNPGCADSNSRIDVQHDASFDIFCGLDMINHVADENNPDLQVADVVGLFAYSLTDCLYACSNAIYFRQLYGQDSASGNMQTCAGVTWDYQMASSNSSNYAN
ncbi:uncharacterized protein Z519_08484 [Cladophialophora bantiana CBS 173.52]|uniref:Apple domain-containing protein n=1 Tax=Cladophialophora bantiana (strain ATCC 10958 / CBS 173.52 / CDC B-1940 / NIH 8579) TaxID=1442370 RepID=A0A0D2EL06_CLAB1|nr:uncharacterized protein Z519_08484 [Cladophialophora bantiana CBS 173.52]KIW90701.1 hypothetical protein Z519_08484 [Cladophialophora bantiana CBS 173.52]